jgi:hypothetical protein
MRDILEAAFYATLVISPIFAIAFFIIKLTDYLQSKIEENENN